MSFLTKSLVVSSFLGRSNCLPVLGQVRYAARKGTREKRAKSKVKVEVQKVGFIPHNQRDREKYLLTRPKRKFDDSWKQLPLDNVYPHRFYKWPVYSFAEAIQCHRETHHPEMYNKPTANLHVSIELNMEGEKKNRFVDNFSRMAPMPHRFDHGEERTIIAFSKSREIQDAASKMGAQVVGGTELIKEIQNGSISLADFQYVVADPAILAELVVLRGLMKKKFPNIKVGTLDADVPGVVNKFVNGISYAAVKDEYEKDFGLIQTIIGTLDMEVGALEENFASLVQDVFKAKPKRSGSFITRCLLLSPPSSEKLKVDHSLYLKMEGSSEEKDTKENPVEQVSVAI